MNAIGPRRALDFPNGPLLQINDASLIFGGRFDLKGLWRGSPYHQGHIVGNNVDIDLKSLLAPNRRCLQQQFYQG